MAAALGSAALGAAQKTKNFLTQSSADELAKMLCKIGVGLVIGGFGLGTIGYFSKAAATAAANNDVQILSNIGTIFSNIQAPTFTPAATGNAPLSSSLQGIQDFGANVWSDAQAAAGDVAQIGGVLGTLGEDVVNGFIDIAKAFLAFVMHFPDLLWNGMVYGVGTAVADVLNWLFPWIVIMGIACLIIGTVILVSTRCWNAIAKPAWDRASGKWAERQEAKFERGLDRLFGNFKHETKAIVAPEPVPALPAPSPAVVRQNEPVVGQPEPELQEENVGSGPASPPAAQGEVQTPPEPSARAPAPAPAPTVIPEAPPEPAPGTMTRTEAEKYLGDRPNRTPTQEEIQRMVDDAEKNRQESLPKKEPEISGYEESRKAAAAFDAAGAAA